MSQLEEVTVLALVVAAVWITIGVVASVAMHRRGHDPFPWAVVFLVLGPLAIPIAVSADRHRPPSPDLPERAGNFDVLVAHDGSPAAVAALDAALELFGSQLTSLTLAMVVDIEAATTVRGRDTTRAAKDHLDGVSRTVALSDRTVETAVLHGDPARVLAECAEQHGYDLIVVGASGEGTARVLRGSVARRLATGTAVPLFVGPRR